MTLYIESEVYSSIDEVAHALKLSFEENVAEEHYKRFYAERINKQNPNEQN